MSEPEKIYNLKDYISIGKAAKIIGVCVSTLRLWEKKGKIKSLRNPFSNHRIYKIEDLKAILELIK